MEFGSDYFEGKTSNYKGGYDGLWMRLHLRFKFMKAVSLIKEYKSAGKLIDLGCAYGYFVNLAFNSGFDPCGCDVSGFAVERAKKMFPNLNFFKADIQGRISFTDRFDVVTAFDVLEHCKNLEGILKNVKILLKSGGMFLISVPDVDLFPQEMYLDRTHFWHLTKGGWVKMLKKSGFVILKTEVYPSWLRRIKPDWCILFIVSGLGR